MTIPHRQNRYKYPPQVKPVKMVKICGRAWSEAKKQGPFRAEEGGGDPRAVVTARMAGAKTFVRGSLTCRGDRLPSLSGQAGSPHEVG